jgi:nucleoside-diphosphate-sugar epimerase
MIKGDLFDFTAIKEALHGVDVVFHLAALVKAPTWQTFEAANVDAAETIVRLAQKAGVKKVVLLSSLAATGPSNGIPVTEEFELKPVSMYGKSKKVMEERITKIVNDSTAITIIRPPAVFGPREENIYSFFKSASKRICPIIGNGETPKVSMIHVYDLIQGIMLASDYEHSGIQTFFISSEQAYTWNQIMSATSQALGKKLFPIYVKPNLVKKVGAFVESAGNLVGHYPILNREKSVELSLEWVCSTQKAQTLLGFRQTISLEQGVLNTIQWYEQHHWI